MSTISTAIIGSGNIGSDLLLKLNGAGRAGGISAGGIRVVAMAGNDPDSAGLARATAMGVEVTSDGIDGLIEMPIFDEIQLVFDASSAAAHLRHAPILAEHNKKAIDLTPAAVGPFVVPTVNLDQHLDAANINMVTCGGQATVPIVFAVGEAVRQLNSSAESSRCELFYAEIVSSIASRSAGPGTRANIDEFTRTTARALETVGGAQHGKAIIILNPADPPILMRNTVLTFVRDIDSSGLGTADVEQEIDRHVRSMVQSVQDFVPGYCLKQNIIIDRFDRERPLTMPGLAEAITGWKVVVYLEVEGAGDFLPAYAGNLDIMTAAAVGAANRWLQTAAGN